MQRDVRGVVQAYRKLSSRRTEVWAPDLIISYRHNRLTGEPLFAGNSCRMRRARRAPAAHCGNDSVLAIDLERLTRSGPCASTTSAMSSSGRPTHRSRTTRQARARRLRGRPDGLPRHGADLPESRPVEGRSELLLSTGAHEMGHGIFEAPAWIYAHQKSAMPGLFDTPDVTARRASARRRRHEDHFRSADLRNLRPGEGLA